MKPDYSKQVKRFLETLAIIKLGDEILEEEVKKQKRRALRKSPKPKH